MKAQRAASGGNLQSWFVYALTDDQLAAIQAHRRRTHRQGRPAPQQVRVSDLSGADVRRLQGAPRGARRAALRLARHRPRRRGGPSRPVQAQLRVLQRAGRAVHRDRPQARPRPMGRPRRLHPRAGVLWRAATASTPARRRPGRGSTTRSANSSSCRRSRCCSAAWRSATATASTRPTTSARRARSCTSSASSTGSTSVSVVVPAKARTHFHHRKSGSPPSRGRQRRAWFAPSIHIQISNSHASIRPRT